MDGQTVLNRLRRGVERYQVEIHAQNRAFYQNAACGPQRPLAFIVACADSRIDIETITSSQPGEIFVTRNVGNMVPPYGDAFGGVTAAIEYAVSGLGVRHIVICGHSDCGAMKALLDPDSVCHMPAVEKWLTHGYAARNVAHDTRQPDETPQQHLWRVTEENVLMQMAHLKTHPSVAAAIARGELTVSGWVYDIATGEVRISENGYRPLAPAVALAQRESAQ